MPDSTPLFRDIEAARSIDRLRELGARMPAMVEAASRTGASTRSVVQFISRCNDAITQRLIVLLASAEGVRLPEGAAYLALGSEGRCEQTLCTDQDSAIVFSDDLPPEKLRDIERFSDRLVDALAEIGFSRCPGNIMASNPEWRHSLDEWKRLLERWITIPTPEHMLHFCMFQDLRSLHGDENLCLQLRDHIRAAVRLPSFFFPNMACHAVRFPPPLTIFGRIRVERSGENRGKVDIKKAGIFAITVGASLLTLEVGNIGGTTWDKLESLGKRGIVNAADLKTIEEAFTMLVRLRIQWQLRELATTGRATNHLDPRVMSDDERRQFRLALKGVSSFVRFMNNRYHLNFISR
ncbi:MAG: DUF294 nucleotidyltransferase-like domain-containing protein [Geobacteraceae bacterium]|nr:DUF294 nucleotidyltransferase-like domain-containing protein [Geobacteraceae bacterium]